MYELDVILYAQQTINQRTVGQTRLDRESCSRIDRNVSLYFIKHLHKL